MSLLDLLGVNRIFKAGKPVDPTRKILNFIGDVTIVDNPGSLRTDITIGAGGGGGDGTVVGPDTSTAGNVTTWNSADGTKLADSGLALADVATEAYVDAAVSAVPGTPLAPAGQSTSGGVTSTTGNTGAATTAARSDHSHGHGDLLGGTLHAVASQSNPGFVSAADKTKLDGIATGATSTPLVTGNQSSPGGVASAASGNTGTATTGARSDHSHGHGDLLGGTLHAVATTTTPGFASAADKTKLDGIATGATSTPLILANQLLTGGVVSANGNTGTNTNAARADHVHVHGDLIGGTLHAVATTSTPGFCSAADKTKLDGIATGATSTPLVAASQANPDVIASGGSTGTAGTGARSDHTHGHGAQSGGTLHAVATASVAGFCSAADKAKLDGIATGATSTPLVTGNQFMPGNITSSITGGNTGTATTAARSDHVHGHGELGGATLHTVATPTAAGFLSGADKGRIDALYASSQATRSASRLIAIDGWPGDPDLRVWRMTGVTPTTVTVSTSGTADANVWYVDLSDDMPPSPLTITALDVRIAGPAGQANVPFGSLVAPRWVLASYDRDNVRAVEIAARIDASTTAAAYQAAHSIAWSGAVAFSSLKRYVIEVTPESGGLALSGTRLLSINMTCTYADSAPVAERFMALLAAKGIFAFEARSNTNDGTNVLTFVDLIDPGRVLTLAGTGKMPKPAANAGFGGALVCHPTGVSLTAFCNRPASEFRALHDGTGMEIRQILQADNANTMVSITTRTGAAGVTILTSSGRNQSYVTNNSAWPGSALINSAPINFPVATPGSSHLRYSASTTPNWTSHVSGGAADVTGQQATTPYAGDSDQTLELFTDGTNHFAGYWFGTYGFHSLTATERALVDEYQLAMTGVLP